MSDHLVGTQRTLHLLSTNFIDLGNCSSIHKPIERVACGIYNNIMEDCRVVGLIKKAAQESVSQLDSS